MLRLLENSSIRDRISTNELLQKIGLLSVNQLAASIKLAEAWKSINISEYPIQLKLNTMQLKGSFCLVSSIDVLIRLLLKMAQAVSE